MRKRDSHAGAEHPDVPPMPEAQGDGEPAPADETIDASRSDDTQSTDAGPQLAEQRDRYLRLAAEYDNFRKRSAKERAEAGARGQAELVTKLIDALDDLSRFAHVDPATTDPHTLHKGIELVEQKAMKALESAGLTVINPIDQTFDPQLHEAVMTEPALSQEDDHTVGRVFQRGYMFNGQLLRPARVVVKQWPG
ncbi:MAG TPA: nucleotide exchange factor GrpE [Gemmatimonadaceae bacterium]|nr:nucleotide exchange factor GrpE [Gemmatimonadaceae bacterium]